MEKITVTALRQNLFSVIDRVLATGEAVEIERHGKRLLLMPEQGAGKLACLKKRSLIAGDAATLPEEKVWEWDENANRP
ncbi:MAG: type II toxin-antitoxin system Phd/YefM family antitoxin [Sulfuricellaceae bacterium]